MLKILVGVNWFRRMSVGAVLVCAVMDKTRNCTKQIKAMHNMLAKVVAFVAGLVRPQDALVPAMA